MLEIKLVIQEDGHDSIIKEFKSKEEAIGYLMVTLDGIVHKVTVEEIKENNLEGIVSKDEEIIIPKKKSFLGRIKK